MAYADIVAIPILVVDCDGSDELDFGNYPISIVMARRIEITMGIDSVVVSRMLKYSKVGGANNEVRRFEFQTVFGNGDGCFLVLVLALSVKIHADFLRFVIDMNVG